MLCTVYAYTVISVRMKCKQLLIKYTVLFDWFVLWADPALVIPLVLADSVRLQGLLLCLWVPDVFRCFC